MSNIFDTLIKLWFHLVIIHSHVEQEWKRHLKFAYAPASGDPFPLSQWLLTAVTLLCHSVVFLLAPKCINAGWVRELDMFFSPPPFSNFPWAWLFPVTFSRALRRLTMFLHTGNTIANSVSFWGLPRVISCSERLSYFQINYIQDFYSHICSEKFHSWPWGWSVSTLVKVKFHGYSFTLRK